MTTIEPFDSLGGKGQAYRPDLCDHAPEDGCMWCCSVCNVDRHCCPGCGTTLGHLDKVCDDCRASYGLA